MAGSPIVIYRNTSTSDTVVNSSYQAWDFAPTIETLGWTYDGHTFKEFNTLRDGSSISIQPGERLPDRSYIYVIWEELPSHYIVERTGLEAVADAIREKTGESGSLIYPSGFVSAIEGIGSWKDITNLFTLQDSDGVVSEWVVLTNESVCIVYITGSQGLSGTDVVLYPPSTYTPLVVEDELPILALFILVDGASQGITDTMNWDGNEEGFLVGNTSYSTGTDTWLVVGIYPC